VEVSVRSEGPDVVLEVADDGIGLPTDDAEGMRRTRGGLAGIRERIAGVGGTFTLENRAQGGALVRVRVPANRESREESLE
jgi:signal transduction histidine kinase